MDKKEFLLWLLSKLQYNIGDPFDNMTNGLIGLVESVGADDSLLIIVEEMVKVALNKTASILNQQKIEEALVVVKQIKNKEEFNENQLEDILNSL